MVAEDTVQVETREGIEVQEGGEQPDFEAEAGHQVSTRNI
jgi:hypothetical protein